MTDTWPGCYDLSWKDAIVPAAFAHPAKMARGLLRRILEHAFEQGWVSKGSVVCDPFGGIGSTAIEGAYRGLQVITCELEPKFIMLAKENMVMHSRHWTTLGCPQPVILQGDSRKLCALVREAGIVVSSPPFVEVTSDKPSKSIMASGLKMGQSSSGDGYGSTPGQLGAMKAGSVQAVVGSPPFSTAETRDKTKFSGGRVAVMMKDAYTQDKQGDSPGQLAALPPGSVSAVVSSPPYEGANQYEHGCTKPLSHYKKTGGPWKQYHVAESPGQIGIESGDTFWSAARLIVEQCYQLLPSGGHAVWVCKDFVRNKQRVPFSDDWLRLCEAVGFRLACRHQAMLVKTWEEPTLFEGTVTRTRERKSFFRRLAEKKGSPRIDHEDVICVMKDVARRE